MPVQFTDGGTIDGGLTNDAGGTVIDNGTINNGVIGSGVFSRAVQWEARTRRAGLRRSR